MGPLKRYRYKFWNILSPRSWPTRPATKKQGGSQPLHFRSGLSGYMTGFSSTNLIGNEIKYFSLFVTKFLNQFLFAHLYSYYIYIKPTLARIFWGFLNLQKHFNDEILTKTNPPTSLNVMVHQSTECFYLSRVSIIRTWSTTFMAVSLSDLPFIFIF